MVCAFNNFFKRVGQEIMLCVIVTRGVCSAHNAKCAPKIHQVVTWDILLDSVVWAL